MSALSLVTATDLRTGHAQTNVQAGEMYSPHPASGGVRAHRNFQGRKGSLNRIEGLDRAEGTMPGAAKVILSFKDNPLRELSSDPQLDFIRH